MVTGCLLFSIMSALVKLLFWRVLPRRRSAIEVEGQEAGGVIFTTPLRILNPSIVSAGTEAISSGE
jgi:hypothetical protein